MKVLQSKLAVSSTGKVLVDSTNLKCTNSNAPNTFSRHSKKRKSENENSQPSKVGRKDGIFTDPPSGKFEPLKTAYVDLAIQTDPWPSSQNGKREQAQRIQDMLTNAEPPAEYWECLAEQRQKTLEATLEENFALKEENEFLKGENRILEEMLEEAKQLAALVQEFTSNTDDPTPPKDKTLNERKNIDVAENSEDL